MEQALSYAHLGETERALEWLERSFQDYTRDLIYLAVEPALDPLRNDPRFQELAGRMGDRASVVAPAEADEAHEPAA